LIILHNELDTTQINFPNYASQLQAIIARSKGAKILKQLTITATFMFSDRTNQA